MLSMAETPEERAHRKAEQKRDRLIEKRHQIEMQIHDQETRMAFYKPLIDIQARLRDEKWL